MPGDSKNWIARIHLPKGGALVLLADSFSWKAEGKVDDHVLRAARAMLEDYQYSPSHGYPGCLHAHEVAKLIGGKVEIGTIPPSDPDVVH